MCDVCGEGWRVEATNLVTGIVKAVIHPIEAEWEEQYSAVGTATLKGSIFGPTADDTWPHTTGIYISRVFEDGTRDGRFGGYMEAWDPDPEIEQVVQFGMQPLDEYLFHRFLADENGGLTYSTPGYVDEDTPGPGLSQTQIAYDLIQIALSGKGFIPLVPVIDEVSEQLRVRHWEPWDFKNIGDAVKELVEDNNGLRYRLSHQFFENPARWVTTMHLMDETETDRGVVLRSDYEAWQYAMEVSAKDSATRVYGVGSGEGANQQFSVAYDEDAGLPEFQKTVAWKDVSVPETLDDLTAGQVVLHRDPATTPSVTLVGLDDVPPEDLFTGDIVTSNIGYGVITFRDQKARATSQTWRLAVDEPVTRALGLEPVIRPSMSVRTQTPALPFVPTDANQADNPPDQTPISPPPPPEGLVVVVNVSSLNEVSGMQYVDGNVELHNDENNNPQIVVVSLSTGLQVGSETVGSPARVDPEALRRHPDGYSILGDIGDNDNNRTTKRLFKVGASDSWAITYEGGVKVNAETLLIHPITGQLIVVSKAETGTAFSFGTGPDYSGVGKIIATGLPKLISDGTFTNDGQRIIFVSRFSDVAWVYRFSDWSLLGTIGVPDLPQLESITMETDCSFLVSTEGKKPPIWRVHIPSDLGGCA